VTVETLRGVLVDFLWWADHGVLVYFFALNTFYAVLLLLAVPELWAHWRIADDAELRRLMGFDALPPISILVPAYNEEVTIAASLLSFLTIEYPRHEVILVNDGSKDRTVDVLIREYDLYEVPAIFPVTIPSKPVRAFYRSRRFSKLLVIDKENGGKADSLNCAMNAARFPYVIACDADTLIEPDALLRMARPFQLGRPIAAVGGTIRVANGCTVEHGRVTDARVDTRWLAGCQVVEYLRAFLFGRLGWNRLGGNLIISGAFGLFKREYLLAIGGYQTGNVTEDMDLVLRLRRHLFDRGIEADVPFIPDPVAWTEVPTSVRVLGRQRERWHRGLVGSMWDHRDLLFSPKYRWMGMVAAPYFTLGELLAPVVEAFGYLSLVLGLLLGAIDWAFAGLFFVVALGYGVLLSIWAIVFDELTFRKYTRAADVARLLLFAVIEPLGFRQMTVWFRLKSFWYHFKGVKSWGQMTREGFGGARPAASAPAPRG
jgi:cellulose synthase/poly-beta-1,6-N-acetylglucosamine synthase-like glycosyltransferase